MRKARESRDLQLYALMVTDVLTKGTDLLVVGDVAAWRGRSACRRSDSRSSCQG